MNESNLNMYEYEAWRSLPENAMRPGGTALTRRLLALSPIAKHQRILDVGCGVGSTVSYLHKEGYDAVGVDISEKLVAEGKRLYPECSLVSTDAARLPFDQGAFDAVISECALSIMPVCVLLQCRRVLQKDGILFISDLYRRKEEGELWSKAQWEECLAKNGFSVITWQDCSDVFAEFVARAIWQHGSLNKAPGSCQWRQAGYFLLAARVAPVNTNQRLGVGGEW